MLLYGVVGYFEKMGENYLKNGFQQYYGAVLHKRIKT